VGVQKRILCWWLGAGGKGGGSGIDSKMPGKSWSWKSAGFLKRVARKKNTQEGRYRAKRKKSPRGRTRITKKGMEAIKR